MFPNYYYAVDDSYFKEHACEHADLWKLQLSVSSWIYYIDYKMRTWCMFPRKHISLTDIQGCVPLMTIMSFIRGLSRKFLWGGGGGSFECVWEGLTQRVKIL